VLITHDADVAAVAERVVHIRDGRIESDSRTR
jgi:predicted ABC-type transport system involved in lysophospholipase L1 biosynthesis ATPase subunit